MDEKMVVTPQVNEKIVVAPRMLNIKSAAPYMGLGPTCARALLKQIGAEKHIGRRVVYDKQVIDAYLDNLAAEPAPMAAAQ